MTWERPAVGRVRAPVRNPFARPLPVGGRESARAKPNFGVRRTPQKMVVHSKVAVELTDIARRRPPERVADPLGVPKAKKMRSVTAANGALLD